MSISDAPAPGAVTPGAQDASRCAPGRKLPRPPDEAMGAPAADSVRPLMDAPASSTADNHLTITGRSDADPVNTRERLLRLLVLGGAATGPIALDPAQLNFTDLAGLRTLNTIERHVSADGASVRVAAVSPWLARLLKRAGPRRAKPHSPIAPILDGLGLVAPTPIPDIATDTPPPAAPRQPAWTGTAVAVSATGHPMGSADSSLPYPDSSGLATSSVVSVHDAPVPGA
jgi:anti-anti-sigma regulatory factor